MKQLSVNILVFLLMAGCNGRATDTEKLATLAAADTIHRPKTDIRVNKKYDDKGNLVQYDSSYSYFYLSPGFGNSSIISDSLFSNLKTPLRNNYKGLLENNMDSIFFNDTLFKYDFYNNDYFSKRYQMNMQRFENMFRQMDSIKSNMFRQTYPDGKVGKN